MSTKAQHDHFIPATYLRRFAVDGKLSVFRKRTGRITPEKPENICRTRNGDLNRYFQDPTALRHFLKALENAWPSAVSNIEREIGGERNAASPDDFFIVAGVIAYIRSCYPTAVRLFATMEERRILDLLPDAIDAIIRDAPDPAVTRSLSDRIMEQGVRVEIDRDHPRAIALQNLQYVQMSILAGKWLIMPRAEEHPFITSDYPACIMFANDNALRGPLYFPLSPSLAVYINHIGTDNQCRIDTPTIGPILFGTSPPTAGMVAPLNTLIAQCADDVLVSSEDRNWFKTLGTLHRDWSMQCLFDELNGRAVNVRHRPRVTPNRWA